MTNDAVAESLSTDVFVIGGGPAGTWAAIKAAQAGCDVVLGGQRSYRFQWFHRICWNRHLVCRRCAGSAGGGDG